jgi:hypothetical protein
MFIYYYDLKSGFAKEFLKNIAKYIMNTIKNGWKFYLASKTG